MQKSKRLSVVIPAYNEEAMLPKTAATIGRLLEEHGIDYELVFVNDGSSDHTWDEIQNVCASDPHIAAVCFSRNFGKEAAVYAGLEYATGDAVAVMDCDLQHPPETLLQMYDLWEQGYEVVEGVKRSRGRESSLHRGFSNLFYDMMSRAMHLDMKNTSDFKLLDRKAVDSILSMPERNLFFRASSVWIGFRSISVEYDVREREAGETKWTTGKLIQYAFTNVVAFTTAPLQWISAIGALSFLCSVVLLVYTLVQYFRGKAVEGYSTILIVLLLIGSAIMLSLGIIGYYLAKIYEEVKGRPRYLVREQLPSRITSKEEPNTHE